MDADQTQSDSTETQAEAATAQTVDAKDDQKAKAEDNYWKRQAEKARQEAEQLRKERMSDAERIKAERDEYKAAAEAANKRAGDLMIQSRFESTATRAGCVDPEAAYALVDRSLLAVDETGKVLGLDRAMKALKEAKPYLFAAEAPQRVGSGGGNPGAPASPPVGQRVNDWIRKASGR